MKLTKKIVALVAVLMTTASVLASEVTVITMLNGVANSNVGSVKHSEANGVCTLTVTPASGYYIDVITAEKTVSGGMAQAPRRRTTPGMDNYLQVSGPQSPFDPSGETTWTFIMPEDESYSVEVIANFKARTSIASATLNLTLPEGGYVFDGEAKEPAVTVTLGGSTLASSNYTVDYSDNINAGTATVTVTGKNTYTGSATKNFTISKAALSDLSVVIRGWIYGQYDEEVNAPRVSGNEGNGAVTYSYKAAGATEFGASVPQNAGTHTVKATIAETANYQGKEVTANFTITKAELTNATVSLEGWTYGDDANIPVVTNNLGDGTVDIFFANTAAPSLDYTADVPANAGNYSIKAVIAESANYQGKEVTNTFSIAKADFSLVTIADIANKTFTGEAIEPDVTVTFKGKAVDASEYTVGYSNNTNVGTATVTLTATGTNFTAETTASKTFQIVPASVTISAEDQTVTYNGSAQAYTGATVAKGSLSIKYATSLDADAEKTTTAPTNAGVYYVTISQTNPNYTSQDATATFTINPKALTGEMVQNLSETSFIYDGKAKTLSFSVKDGASVLVESDDYTVTYSDNINVGVATATVTGNGNYTGFFILDFEILRKLNVSFSETNSWATYCATEDLSIPEGLQVYVVTGVDASSVSVEQIDYLPANEGVLLHLEEPALASDGFIAAKDNAAHSELPNNYLEGITAATLVSSLTADGSSIYVLYKDEFVKTTSGTIPANRCYLPIDMNVNVNARLTISFADDDNETTSLNEELRMKNEESVDAWYDMQGRKVAQPAKGLYIVNGKKVVIK